VELAAPAVMALLRTGLGMFVFSLLMAGVSYSVAASASAGRGFVAVAFTLVVCLVLGAVLAVKRAVLSALIYGLGKMELGRRTLELIFGRLLGVDETAPSGERGGVAARALERMPLAQAEARLSEAVRGLLKGDGNASWLRRGLQTQLLQRVEKLTLARFRSEGAAHGGVDLPKMRALLADEMDQLLRDTLDAALMKITAVVILVAGGLSLLLAFALRHHSG